DRPSFDFIAQAMSGFMATTGEKDGAPMRAAPPIPDLGAGLYCRFGVVNAIRARQLTGRGQRVEAAMVNGMVSMLAYLASEYLSTGRTPQRNGNIRPSGPVSHGGAKLRGYGSGPRSSTRRSSWRASSRARNRRSTAEKGSLLPFGTNT